LGLRKGELLALRWDDVDLDGGVLHVRQNVQRLPEMGLVFGPPKSNKSRRTIPLPAASAKVLRTHRASQAAEALALGPAWIDSGLVFTSTVGTVIEPRNLNRFFDELITKAGVRRIRFHDLRHTCASLLLAQNVPARVVMEILGHSQLAMTTDLYSHVMPDCSTCGRGRNGPRPRSAELNCVAVSVAVNGPSRASLATQFWLGWLLTRVNTGAPGGVPGGIRTPNLLIRRNSKTSALHNPLSHGETPSAVQQVRRYELTHFDDHRDRTYGGHQEA
jgi:Phage integrase family